MTDTQLRSSRTRLVSLLAALILLGGLVGTAQAYIGPGAGFAVIGSFLVLFLAVLAAIVTLLTWPIRWVFRVIRGRRVYGRGRIKRLVILGLDGMEPSLVDRMLAEGKLPNLARLRDEGTYSRLGTTTPPLSPVAWSCFLTGTNPGKHCIFDFLNRDLKTYLPLLSSVRIRPPMRTLKIGKYHVPISKPEMQLLRRSQPFWKILGKHGVFSSVIRVPITFPPEKFRGVSLSAMCVPDLRGSQGIFTFYSTREDRARQHTGGEVRLVERNGRQVRADLIGPADVLKPDASEPLKIPFVVTWDDDKDTATLKIGGEKIKLRRGEYTPWVAVTFKAGLGIRVHGLCKFLLLGTEPDFELYVMPINIDPAKPAMPISHPKVYATYLAKRIGAYATLGLAEDTWALDEELISHGDFLKQSLEDDEEREKMFFDALKNTRRGMCCVVFDGTDRLQHMFWRPMEQGESNGYSKVIEEHFVRMDKLVAKTRSMLNERDTMLMVISDHGFGPFRRGVDLNRWLLDNGYLAMLPGHENDSYLRGIDWSRTRMYAVGLAGMYVNQKGREAQGIVEPGEQTRALKKEIIGKLEGLSDPETGETAITSVYDQADVYRGPYADHGPDLIVGYNRGYRVGWETAIGEVTDRVIHKNTKAWSGDHCIDPKLVPGIFFCTHKLASENPRLMDLGPTALDLFGVPIPGYMDGRPLKFAGVNA